MKIDSNKEEPIELFFQMEKEFNLFELRTSEGFPIWDILRFRIYHELFEYHTPNGNNIKRRKKNIPQYLISLINLFKPLKKTLFFTASRNLNEKNQLFDKNSDAALTLIGKKEISIIESFTPTGSYKYEKRNILLNTLTQLIASKISKKKHLESELKIKINHAIKTFFSECIIKSETLDGEFNSFYQNYQFYNFLFRHNKRVEKIFITQNGIQKGLFLAARNNKIRSYEFQHGIIDKRHTAYSYNANIRYKNDDVILPDVFFTFSKYWNSVLYNPYSKMIECGNDYFYAKEPITTTKGLTVVSSVLHEDTIRPFVKEIAINRPSLDIYYKLHPNQYFQKEDTCNYFSNNVNIQIITSEYSIPQLVSKTKATLTIASTAVYESLHAGTKVLIFKKQNYCAHQDIFELPGVFLIESINDFEKAFEADVKIQDLNLFFSPFNKELFLETINLKDAQE